MTAVFLGALLFGWTVWAVMLWASLKAVDTLNYRNTFAAALGFSVLHLLVEVVAYYLAFFGSVVVIAWCGGFVLMLIHTYELGFVKAIAVATTTALAPYLALEPFVAAVERMEPRFLVVMFATPVAILLGWRLLRVRALVRENAETTTGDVLPQARLRKPKRKAS